MENKVEEEIFDEISEEDLPDIALDENIMSDEDVLSVEELLDRIIGAINLLDHIDEYKEAVSKKRREVEYRQFDIDHILEDIKEIMDKNPDFKLTAKGCRNIIEEMAHLRQLRRILKVSDTLIYEFQKRTNRLNNAANRSILRNDIYKEKNNLTKPHHNRIYTQEQLYKFADIKQEEIEELKNKEDNNE